MPKKKQYIGIDGQPHDTPTGDDGSILTSAMAEEIARRTAGKSPRRPPAAKSSRHGVVKT